MNKNDGGYNGLANPRWLIGSDLSDSNNESKPQETTPTPTTEPTPVPAPVPQVEPIRLPSKFLGKNWDDLYRSDDLETIRNHFPEHYEKLKSEKFKPKK